MNDEQRENMRKAFLAGWLDRSMQGKERPYQVEEMKAKMEFEKWLHAAEVQGLLASAGAEKY